MSIKLEFWNRQTLRDKPARMLVDYKNALHAKKNIGNWQCVGSKSGRSKLNEKQVKEIIERLKVEDYKIIAKDYGVTASTVNSIKSGKTWSWLTNINRT